MTASISPISKTAYEIPDILDDTSGIEEFLAQNSNKKVIVVQGMGFVGAVMALVCANALTEEYAVIGVDLADEANFWKIKSINDGIFPLVADDPKISNFFEIAKRKGNLYATYDDVAYSFADVVIIDINLDVNKKSNELFALEKFDVDLSGFKKAIASIGDNIRDDALILVETTVPPGTCEKIVKPILEKKLTERGLPLNNLKIGHSYERVMPGPEYIDSIRSFPRVYSGINSNSADSVEEFLNTIIDTSTCDLTRMEHTNATEIAKVLENSFRAMNIAFAVEWSRFAEEAGVDMYSIVNAIRVRKTHSNLMYPGIGVGGYCLTKDPLLASWSRKEFFSSNSDLNMSIKSVSINDQMPRYCFNRLVDVYGKLNNKTLCFLGVSYRGDVGDTRFTPVGPLFDLVSKDISSISLHDPYITFWDEKNINVENDINKVLDKNLDIIIITTGHTEYKSQKTLDKLMKIKSTNIFDTIGIFNEMQLSKLSKKHKVSVLGRGDL